MSYARFLRIDGDGQITKADVIHLRDVNGSSKGLDQIGEVVIAVSAAGAQRDAAAVLEYHRSAVPDLAAFLLALYAVGVLHIHIQRVVAVLELQTQGGDVEIVRIDHAA